MTVATEPASPQTKSTATGRMKALVYHGPGKRAWEETPRPAIEGRLAGCDAGPDSRARGHRRRDEGGTAVTAVHPGDRVIISCVAACGKCDDCRKGMYSHCRDGDWILGNTIDLAQTEFVRIPHADMSLYHFPAGGDEEALVMLSDILPTDWRAGVFRRMGRRSLDRRPRRTTYGPVRSNASPTAYPRMSIATTSDR